MAVNQDARPFVDLKKDAEEFETKFKEDIEECLNVLDAKLTALICDPDSLENKAKSGLKHNTMLEFSKAKYEIFMSVKSLINKKEREWQTYISEMKKLFIENVEIFLAGTKLEVKLPPLETSGPRKSPGNRKSISSITGSVYPLLNSITKNIPVLSSTPIKQITTGVEDKAQFNRRSRLPVKLTDPPRAAASHVEKDITDSSENEAEAVMENVQLKRRGRQPATSIKLSKATMQIRKETSDIEMDPEEVAREPEDTSEMDTGESDLAIQDNTVSEIQQDVTVSKSARGQRGKQPVRNGKLNSVADSKKLPGRSSSLKDAVNQVAEDVVNPMDKKETNVEVVSVKGRRGRTRATKASDNVSVSEDKVAEEINPVNEKPPSVNAKNRRGRSAPPKHDNASENEAEENVNSENEPTVEVVNGRGRRSRSAVPKTSDKAIPTRKPVRGRKSIKIVDEAPELASSSQTSSDEQSDQDVSLYVARVAKPRRKTLLPTSADIPDLDIIPGHSVRGSKRKTIGGASASQTAAPSKRLKVSKNLSSVQEDASNDNLLGSGENYSEWMPLKDVGGKIPTHPAVYELKIQRGKTAAYIGSSESLRQKLTMYKLRQNSGHKHLDKFIDRNFNNIQVRFEIMSSVEDANDEQKSRVKRFVDQYKKYPPYN